MKTLQVYDPAMCCSTGVCGPQVDPVLVRFAGDLKWLQEQGVAVQRFSLAQNPAAYVENDLVKAALTEKGEAALPLVLVDGETVASGQYPEREQLAGWCGVASGGPGLFSPAVAELVAIGAAIASNCEPCLRYHVHEAEKLGVTMTDINAAIAMAAKVKDAPHRNVMRLATRLTESAPAVPVAAADGGGETAATPGGVAKSGCCS
jgi:AhpD family alkylhydroperoxidase